MIREVHCIVHTLLRTCCHLVTTREEDAAKKMQDPRADLRRGRRAKLSVVLHISLPFLQRSAPFVRTGPYSSILGCCYYIVINKVFSILPFSSLVCIVKLRTGGTITMATSHLSNTSRLDREMLCKKRPLIFDVQQSSMSNCQSLSCISRASNSVLFGWLLCIVLSTLPPSARQTVPYPADDNLHRYICIIIAVLYVLLLRWTGT